MYRVKPQGSLENLRERHDFYGYFSNGRTYRTRLGAAISECARAVKCLWRDGKYFEAFDCTGGLLLPDWPMLLEVLQESREWLEKAS
jgi:hypothetical protein